METPGEPVNAAATLMCLQLCGNCDVAAATVWCLDCNGGLCDNCELAHRRVSLTRNHRLHNQLLPDAPGPTTRHCALHPSEPLELICLTCKTFTCRDCQLTNHMNHSHQFVSESMANVKKHMLAYATPIRAQAETVNRSLRHMETRLKYIDKSKSHLKNDLLHFFSMIIKRLKTKMKDIVSEIEEKCNLEGERIASRTEALKQLQRNQTRIIAACEESQSCFEFKMVLMNWKKIKEDLEVVKDQDLFPPSTMSHLLVCTQHNTAELIERMVFLQTGWIPFAVPQEDAVKDNVAQSDAVTPASSSSSEPGSTFSTSVPASSCRFTSSVFHQNASTCYTNAKQGTSTDSSWPGGGRASDVTDPILQSSSTTSLATIHAPNKSLPSACPQKSSSKIQTRRSETDPVPTINLSHYNVSHPKTNPASYLSSHCVTSFHEASSPHLQSGSSLSVTNPKATVSKQIQGSPKPVAPNQIANSTQSSLDLTLSKNLTTSAKVPVEVRCPLIKGLLDGSQQASSAPNQCLIQTWRFRNTLKDSRVPKQNRPPKLISSQATKDQSQRLVQAPTVPGQSFAGTTGVRGLDVTARVPTQNIIQAPMVSSPNVVQAPMVSSPNLVQAPMVSSPNVVQAPMVSSPNLVQAPMVSSPNVVQAPMVSSPNLVQAPMVSSPNLVQAPMVSSPNPVHAPMLSNLNLVQTAISPSPTTGVLGHNTAPSVPSWNIVQAPMVFSPSLVQAPMVSGPTVVQPPSFPSPNVFQALQFPIPTSVPAVDVRTQNAAEANTAPKLHRVQSPRDPSPDTVSVVIGSLVKTMAPRIPSPGGPCPGLTAPQTELPPNSADLPFNVQAPVVLTNAQTLCIPVTLYTLPKNMSLSDDSGLETSNTLNPVSSGDQNLHQEDADNEPSTTVSEEPEPKPRESTTKATSEPATADNEPSSTVPEDPKRDENEPTTTTSEEYEKITSTSDIEAVHEPPTAERAESDSAIGRQDCNVKLFDPRVSLLRIPVSDHEPGCSPPSFRVVVGDSNNKIYLKEMEAFQSPTPHPSPDFIDLTDSTDELDQDCVLTNTVPNSPVEDGLDLMEPLLLPESPFSLEVLSCSVCTSSESLIICSVCARGFHRHCHVPEVKSLSMSSWNCSLCRDVNDQSDPSSSERPAAPRDGLRLQDQRRCEALLLFVKVQTKSPMEQISKRLTLRHPSPYRRVAQFVSDVEKTLNDMSQDKASHGLKKRFLEKVKQTFGPGFDPSPPTNGTQAVAEKGDESKQKLRTLKRRLRNFLDQQKAKKIKTE